MLFHDYERYSYQRAPLIETICQLRFPSILNIGAQEPAEFQEAIRHEFPRYAAKTEQLPPRLVNQGTPEQRLEPQPPIQNYNFISEDGFWKINLTRDFIALSTLRYAGWEDFAQKLDKPLASFLQIYQPAPFERIGLRYVNAFSRKRLGLEESAWNDLLEPPFLGPLDEDDIVESSISKCSIDLEARLAGDILMKMHAGPGLLGGGKQDPEVKFILDGDFAAHGQITPDQIPQRLEAMHQYAVRLFLGSMTNTLFTALGPMESN